MAERTAVQKSLVGPSGEHFVLFRLYQQGMLASLSPPGSPTIDVLILAADESVIATLQVKTRTRGADGGWHMGEKHEHISQPRCFYAFVDLEVPVGSLPVTYIIPSSEVAKMVAASYRAWLEAPGKGGREHQDTPLRRVQPAHPYDVPDFPDGWMDRYRERWDLLKAVVGTGPADGKALPEG